MLHDNLSINQNGNLTFAGFDTVELCEKYGTPLMLLDETGIRARCRLYKSALKKYFGENSLPMYAGKALCFKGLYRILKEEQMGVDVVSMGEMYTALEAGFPLEYAHFHGNNKTDEEIEFALEHGVGCFVADNCAEIEKINELCAAKGKVQDVIIRVSPGIDPHTHAKISTGKVDSKFGVALETGQAEQLVAYVLTLKNINLKGFAVHIGSQIFEVKPFCDAADIMIRFIGDMTEKYDKVFSELCLGGGFGVRYVAEDGAIDYVENIRLISEHIKSYCRDNSVPMPTLTLEPGRSIVADNGVTLYTVGNIKEIKGYKNYVSIDGGMSDNPRYALYQSKYTCLIANKADKPADYACTVAGKCCESGDLIQENVLLANPQRGDKLAVLVTGAYNYSMASNYNRIARPAIVMLGTSDYLAVRRESLADLVKNDI